MSSIVVLVSSIPFTADTTLCMSFKGNPYNDDTNPHVRLLIVKKLLLQELNMEKL